MMNCVMLVKDRPKLTRQALTTFSQNTDVDWTLTIIDDASQKETADMLRFFAAGHKGKVALLRNETSSGITAQVRNLGVYWSERRFGRGNQLCLLDNDCYFTPEWASILRDVYLDSDLFLIGGVNHPYHQPITHRDTYKEYLAVAGTCWLLTWATWYRFGPLVETGAPGPGQSEDADLCNKIRAAGGKVGAIWPEVVYDCGIRQTGGNLSPGWDIKEKNMKPGVIYE